MPKCNFPSPKISTQIAYLAIVQGFNYIWYYDTTHRIEKAIEASRTPRLVYADDRTV